MPSPPEDLVRLAVEDVAITVDLREGARAVSWMVGRVELLGAHGGHPIEHGMYPMAPWAGRLRGNSVDWAGHRQALPVTHEPWAIHGTALSQPAQVLDRSEAPGQARLVARIAEHPGWPWPMAVDVEWVLRAHELTTRITVHAMVESFPAVVGWHPWFRRDLGSGRPLEWSMAAQERLVRGDDHLPTGTSVPFLPTEGPFDDAFRVPDGRATVTWPDVLAIDISSEGEWFVIFDELPSYVCVEPQSGPPDGLRSDNGHAVSVAEPGRPLTMSTTWRMRDLSDARQADRG